MIDGQKICVIFINWNDSYYIPFLARHYSFADEIIMYDNHSTDNSVALAEQHGFTVRKFGVEGELNDGKYLDVKNQQFKRFRHKFDWFIVIDADEFVIVDDLRGTVPRMSGFNMVSDHLPQYDMLEINTGYDDENYAKQALFHSSLDEIKYTYGSHKAFPKGNIDRSGSARLYHYRCIGGFDRLWNRHQIYQKRMSAMNLKYGLGIHYLTDLEPKQKEWQQMNELKNELW